MILVFYDRPWLKDHNKGRIGHEALQDPTVAIGVRLAATSQNHYSLKFWQ
jgi:hypothetical protein